MDSPQTYASSIHVAHVWGASARRYNSGYAAVIAKPQLLVIDLRASNRALDVGNEAILASYKEGLVIILFILWHPLVNSGTLSASLTCDDPLHG